MFILFYNHLLSDIVFFCNRDTSYHFHLSSCDNMGIYILRAHIQNKYNAIEVGTFVFDKHFESYATPIMDLPLLKNPTPSLGQ